MRPDRNPGLPGVSQHPMRRITTLLVLAAVCCALAPAAPAQAFSTVSRGDRGPDVRLVQKALRKLGYRMALDGVFGRQTHRVVHRYERHRRLAVDGRVTRGQARGLLRRARMGLRRLDALSAAAPPRAAVAGSALFPIRGAWRAGEGFGTRSGRHRGVDLMAACGTPLVAAHAGRVVFTGRHSAAGNYVVVRSAATREDHVLMHLQGTPETARGDTVQAGQRLGAVGRTGNATACHLHLEIWTAPGWYEGGRPRDPRADLARWSAGTP
jgi:murein DD-endopeptidase MepM/ murein hydrolase activator NlpD